MKRLSILNKIIEIKIIKYNIREQIVHNNKY